VAEWKSIKRLPRNSPPTGRGLSGALAPGPLLLEEVDMKFVLWLILIALNILLYSMYVVTTNQQLIINEISATRQVRPPKVDSLMDLFNTGPDAIDEALAEMRRDELKPRRGGKW